MIEWKHLPREWVHQLPLANTTNWLLINRVFSVFANPRKLGEGVYGEVFATTYDGIATALKVILIVSWLCYNKKLYFIYYTLATFKRFSR